MKETKIKLALPITGSHLQATMSSEPFVEGQADFKDYKTWYRVYGNLESSASPPIVILHGGPGIPHPYMLPFSDLSTKYNIPVVIYDQLGCGNSTLLPNTPVEFWTLDLFMDQLESLLAHLKISDKFYLLGHSWGSMLGSWFAATRQPAGLKALILADGLARMRDWTKASVELVSELPADVGGAINAFELDEKIYTPEWDEARTKLRSGGIITPGFEETIQRYKAYGAVVPQFHARFVCRLQPWPAQILESLQMMSKDSTVSNRMFGPTNIRCTGSLKDFDVVEHLPKIQVPTLVYNGDQEQAQDWVVQPFFDHIPCVKWVKFSRSAHMPQFEERERCMSVISNFLSNI